MAGVRWHIIRTILVCVCLLSFSFYGMTFFSLSDFMLIVGDFLFYSFKATLYYATTMPYDNFTFLITLRLQNIFTLYVCVCVCVLRGVPIIRSSSRVNLLLPVCFLSRKCGVLGSLSIHFLFVLFHFLRCSREFLSPILCFLLSSTDYCLVIVCIRVPCVGFFVVVYDLLSFVTAISFYHSPHRIHTRSFILFGLISFAMHCILISTKIVIVLVIIGVFYASITM